MSRTQLMITTVDLLVCKPLSNKRGFIFGYLKGYTKPDDLLSDLLFR